MSKNTFKAALIKYRASGPNSEFVWFWINPSTMAALSGQFKTQAEAERWFDDTVAIHEETYHLLNRLRHGSMYTVRAIVDPDDITSSKKSSACNFTMHIEDDILEVELLATSIEHARERVEEYFSVIEWIE